MRGIKTLTTQKRLRLLTILIILGSLLCTKTYSQNFTPVASAPTFEGVYRGDIVFADLDSDGDSDVIVSGEDRFGGPSTKVYFNDGVGNFTEEASGIIDARSGSLAAADIDSDGDIDVVVTGFGRISIGFAALYRNDGLGSFTEVEGFPFSGLDGRGEMAFVDVDGDGDVDFFSAGLSSGLAASAQLLLNNGSGTFSQSDVEITPVIDARFDFADIDGDGDNDLFLTGTDLSGENYISQLYLNDGSGHYSTAETDIPELAAGAVRFSDVDGDEDPDLFVAGTTAGNAFEFNLYLNNGSGNLARAQSINYGVEELRDLILADIDEDGSDDLVVTGVDDPTFDSNALSALFRNDGAGSFIESTDISLGRIETADFADVDNDGDLDFISIQSATNGLQTILFDNNKAPTLITGFPKLELEEGFGQTTLNLAEFFEDPDGDELNYSVMNSNTDVVQAAIQGSNLILSEIRTGSTSLEISAFDGIGGLTETTFLVGVGVLLSSQGRDTYELRLYPNPATHHTTLSGRQSLLSGNLSIFSLDGRSWPVQVNRTPEALNIDVDALDAGIYILTISETDRHIHMRLIKH